MRHDSRKYVLELDGKTYLYAAGRLEPIKDLPATEGDKWFVTDMQKAIPRAMSIETPSKYAELMVRRKLHESGEFEDPVSVITHLKRKRSRNITDIFFTAVPTHIYQSYLDQIKALEDNVLLFPIYAVLFGVLQRIRSPEPVAVVFQYSRFAELIIGDRKEIYYANRCLAFDASEEQILALWDLVRLDIKTIEAERGIAVAKIFLITWIDSAPVPAWPEDRDRELHVWEQEVVSLQGHPHQISFLNAVRMQSGFRCSSPLTEKINYYTRTWTPWLNIFLVLAVFLIVFGSFKLQQHNRQLQRDIDALERAMVKTDLRFAADMSQQRYDKTLDFIKELAYSTSAPSYRRVINDLSETLAGNLALEVVKLDYSDQAVHLEFFGQTAAPFEEAHRGYQHFLKSIKGRGYEIKESRFDTAIKSSQIFVKLKKPIQ